MTFNFDINHILNWFFSHSSKDIWLAQKIFGWTTLSLAICIVSDTPVHLILKQCILLSCSQLFSTSDAFSQWAGALNLCWNSIDQNWQTKNTDDMSLVPFLRLLWAFSLTKHASMTRREVMKKAHPGWGGWNRCMVPLVGAHLYC